MEHVFSVGQIVRLIDANSIAGDKGDLGHVDKFENGYVYVTWLTGGRKGSSAGGFYTSRFEPASTEFHCSACGQDKPLVINNNKVIFKPEGIEVGCTKVSNEMIEVLYLRTKGKI